MEEIALAKFIVIDGLDGSGKATQTKLLENHFKKKGKHVVRVSFPDYESKSSEAVKMYLNGELGDDPNKLNPYMCSSFYAVDRAIQYYTNLEKYFKEDDNTIILADRYLSANIIHQGSKIKNEAERRKFINWCYDYECNLMKLPMEDVTIILTVKPETSQSLMTARYSGDESKKDLHEGNLEYLINCYKSLKSSLSIVNDGRVLPHWIEIECDNTENTIYSIDDIHKIICSIADDVVDGKLIKASMVKNLKYENKFYWE